MSGKKVIGELPYVQKEEEVPIFWDPVQDHYVIKDLVMARITDSEEIQVQRRDGKWVELPVQLYGHYALVF